ncbi:DUF927 domain-containing protein [Ferrovibrio sp.]|uniref:DUF927 domain-containing protein n=1 Tax=Ferrovibrio sp. TaxID=1917215 RepID=UPI0035B02864
MAKEFKVTYLGTGTNSAGVRCAVLSIATKDRKPIKAVLPLVPVNGIEPETILMDAVAALDVPLLTRKSRSQLLGLCEVAIKAAKEVQPAIIADAPGWLPNGQFLDPRGKLIGESEIPVGICLHGVARPNRWKPKGTLKAFKEQASIFGEGNSTVIFCTASALAGPLLKVLGLEGVIFCFQGPSSTGKTSTLDFACSVVGGDPDHKQGFRSSWNTTDNAVEALAYEGSDSLAAMDDTLLLSGRGSEKGQALSNGIFSLTSGGEKRRLNARSSAVAPRIIGWSCSNYPLKDMLVKAGIPFGEMFSVRYIEIPVSWRHGMFETTGDMAPAEFSSALSQASRQNYGWAFRRFVRKLSESANLDPAGLEEYLSNARQVVLHDMNLREDEKSGNRAANYFALVYQAGCLAYRFRALPWHPKIVRAAVLDCWKRHREHLVQAAASSPMALLRDHIRKNVRTFATAGEDANLLEEEERHTQPGFLKAGTGGQPIEFMFTEDALRRILGSQDRIDLLVSELRQAGFLITSGGNSRPKRQIADDWRPRVLCVSPRLLG